MLTLWHRLKWINRDTGRRSDSAHAYIHSTRAVHSNLHLMCSTKADKVVIENGRAVGVQVVPTKFLSSGQPQSKIVRARKQIIVSCGTLSSPLVLQRSGIGRANPSTPQRQLGKLTHNVRQPGEAQGRRRRAQGRLTRCRLELPGPLPHLCDLSGQAARRVL